MTNEFAISLFSQAMITFGARAKSASNAKVSLLVFFSFFINLILIAVIDYAFLCDAIVSPLPISNLRGSLDKRDLLLLLLGSSDHFRFSPSESLIAVS